MKSWIGGGGDTMGWVPPPEGYGQPAAPYGYGAPPPPREAPRRRPSWWERLRGQPAAPQQYGQPQYGQPAAPYGRLPTAPYGRSPAPPEMNSWERWKLVHGEGSNPQDYVNWWHQYGAAGASINGELDDE